MIKSPINAHSTVFPFQTANTTIGLQFGETGLWIACIFFINTVQVKSHVSACC